MLWVETATVTWIELMLAKLGRVFLHLLLFGVVVAIGTYWAIRIMTPPPTSTPPLQPAAAPREADPVQAARLFGLVQEPARVALNVEVVGVFAAGKDSAAILAVDGKAPRVVLLGQAVGPGAKLAGVTGDAVTIEQNGAQQQVRMPPRPPLALGGPAPAPTFSRQGNVLTAPTVGAPTAPNVPQPRMPPSAQSGFQPGVQPGAIQPGMHPGAVQPMQVQPLQPANMQQGSPALPSQ